jgi:hypothetical protein
MAEQGETNPFDLADIRTIFVDSSSAEGIATAVADLSRHVNATIPPVPIAPEVDELIRTLVLYEYLFDPLYSGPSGALTPPQLILTELRAANTKLSGESGLPRWTKLDFVREITSLIDLLRQRNLRPSRRGSQIADWPSAVPIAA